MSNFDEQPYGGDIHDGGYPETHPGFDALLADIAVAPSGPEAYRLGYSAAILGRQIDDMPYDRDISPHVCTAWLAGWRCGMDRRGRLQADAAKFLDE